ncbi:hypothetical protein PR002_g2993 [Phytophthora rubi]|uniref:Uncharacterized protein n=1 Tax=Phytophthora rubi TaxID=129364 RepID=A0A6A3NLB8_9STRA|nr:hypothetical protein PR002_g2993 [Phytophthora rubi]
MARPLAALGHRCQPLLTSSGLIDAAAESCQAHRVAVAASATPNGSVGFLHAFLLYLSGNPCKNVKSRFNKVEIGGIYQAPHRYTVPVRRKSTHASRTW